MKYCLGFLCLFAAISGQDVYAFPDRMPWKNPAAAEATAVPRAEPQERTLPPRDDGDKDPSFAKFRETLITAVKQKNLNYLKKIVDPDINYSFGGGGGFKEMIKFWNLNQPDSGFWDKFLSILSRGGVLSEIEGKTYFTAPYYFDLFPEDLDPTEYDLIVAKDVSLRASPDAGSKEVAKLSYNFVKIDYDKSVPIGDPDDFNYSWLKVTTLGGQSGYVESANVDGPFGYRAVFVKNGSEWILTAFVEGD
jgi:hypothetical protein